MCNQAGLDWGLLIYNVENWLPFALYLTAGAATGYVHDKNENEINFQNSQAKLIHEKYEFLYGLYNEITDIKNRLREEVVGCRDSFGRFFTISGELDKLHEDDVFLHALSVLEDVMQNEQIAIYSVESSGKYARLEVKSKNIKQNIAKSPKLSDFRAALDSVKKGEIFQNAQLLPKYPAYIAPIMNNGDLVAMVMLWEASFDQFSMYYFNLLKVVTGLIQSSLARAAIFRNTNLEDWYLPDTRILKPAAFDQTVNIRKQMRKNRISDFQILSVKRDGKDWVKFYEVLSKSVRDEDVIGLVNEKDTSCYVLFTQALKSDLDIIEKRLTGQGLECKRLDEIESVKR